MATNNDSNTASMCSANAAEEITKSTFYGKRQRHGALNLKAKLAKKEKEFKTFPAPLQYQRSLSRASSFWKVYHRQDDAISFATAKGKTLHVFSCESASFCEQQGQRLYLVTSYDEFWHYYRQLQESQKHHYEVIPSGCVCRLYFDLEFYREFNPKHNGDEAVDIFIKYVCCHLQDVYHIQCKINDILQLDASTDSKFSRHLIFHLPGAAFLDNVTSGYFVQTICHQLWNLLNGNEDLPNTGQTSAQTETLSGNLASNQDGKNEENVASGYATLPENFLQDHELSKEKLKKCSVTDKSGRPTLICDLGVYTKNRNFRLIESSKLKKNNPLTVAECNQFLPQVSKGTHISQAQQLFLDSLVSNVQYTENLRLLSHDPSKGCAAKIPMPHIANRNTADVCGRTLSPYPEIDAFIRSVVTCGGVQGDIRRWAYFSPPQLLVFDICHNRWCERVQRPHRSNNIIMVADLQHGVYYQKCHDQECKAVGFKSEAKPLPEHVLPATFYEESEVESGWGGLGDDGQFDVTDEDLLQAVAEADMTDDDLLLAVTNAEQSSA